MTWMDDYYKRSPKYLGYDIPREKKGEQWMWHTTTHFKQSIVVFFNARKQIIFSVCPTTQWMMIVSVYVKCVEYKRKRNR